MDSASDIDDLTVLAPDGSRSSFHMDVVAIDSKGTSRMVMKSLVRTVC
jgi:NADH-quinone oxidoreductase subunit G